MSGVVSFFTNVLGSISNAYFIEKNVFILMLRTVNSFCALRGVCRYKETDCLACRMPRPHDRRLGN